MSEQFETTWASNDRALLDVALAALPSTVAVGPVVRVEWGGMTSYAVRLSTTVAPLGAPPLGVRQEVAPVAGVFMQGPKLPSVIEWMDRIHKERQADVLDALQATKEARRFYARMLGAGEIDPAHPDTIEGVHALLANGVLTSEEANSLLRV